MKKIYISADIEGIWGNSNPAFTMRGGALYDEYRLNMINEVNLAADLLFKNGVTEITVNDGHGNMENLLPSRLDKRVSFVTSNGAFKEYGMMEGFNDTFDGAIFLGYHCRSNSHGVMAHTISGSLIHSVSVDGRELGETGINGLLAEEYGVPVILVTGDDLLRPQAESELSAPFFYVETKKALNSQSAVCCSWNMLESRYETAIKEALKLPKQDAKKAPHTMDIVFRMERNADFAARMDGVTRSGDCSVRLEKDDFDSLYRYMRFVIKTCNAFAG